MISLLTAWNPPAKKTVVFFGDSITQMGVDKGGYIWRVQQALNDKKLQQQYNLIGAGIGGNKVYDLYLRLENDVLARKPDVVFIYVGVNDVWHKTSFGTGTDLDKFGKFYSAIIRKVQARKARVILVTPGGIGELKDNANPQDKDLNQYCDAIRRLATEHNCGLLDLRAMWQEYNSKNNTSNKESGQLTTDRVHLNDNGNQLLAEAVMAQLGIKP